MYLIPSRLTDSNTDHTTHNTTHVSDTAGSSITEMKYQEVSMIVHLRVDVLD